MPTEKEEIEEAAKEILKAIEVFHGKLDAILERVTALEKLVTEAEIEIMEEEEELPCSQPRSTDYWIDREAKARARQQKQPEAQQIPRAYPWNRKCDWTYK